MFSIGKGRKPISDFWWLTSEEARQYRYVDLFHQEAYSDEPNTDRDPCSCPMRQSDKRHELEFLSQWKVMFGNMNVFRSYALYNSDIEGEGLIGPLLLDIDRTQEGSYAPDFDRALKDTRLLVKEYCSSLEGKNYRIFFTGHKGFHIEIHPRAISTPHNIDRWQYFENVCKDINKKFGDDFVDKFHNHVRLHNSINSWIDCLGRRVCLMSYEISVDEVHKLSIESILKKARTLACAALDS
ncbi:MAG: hypothetical protein FJZ85_00955 [Chloroflexi bacterium]|nr:hypothetical protein [Chloroflexota bacterium]